MNQQPRPVRPLPAEVVERIAAGEVILSPVAAVKELVENALDAGATTIDIELRHAGLDLIRVRDNGCGIPADQIEAAFERHATSKIADLDDLEQIRSYGFRGEALASLITVADITLSTATAPGQGVTVRYEAGALVRQQRQARNRGTSVTVENLFQRLPARLAMLEDTRRENTAIALLVRRLALAAPAVRILLTVDGRTDFRSPGDGDPRSVLVAWYGDILTKTLVPLPAAAPGGAALSGWVSGPERSWTSRRHLHLFVNGRWVENKALLAALEQGYRPLLPRGRHPLAVIFLDLPPGAVDLNVHAAKLDVRFRWEAETATGLAHAVRTALSSRLAVPRDDDLLAFTPYFHTRRHEQVGSFLGESRESYFSDDFDFADSPLSSQETGQGYSFVRGPNLPPMRLLSQARNTVLLTEGPDGLYLVDQHRAHERVLYDRLRQRAAHRSQSSVRYEVAGELRELPSPLVVELPAGRHANALRATLEAAGFACRSFAGRAFLLAGVPGLPGWEPAPDDLLAALNDSDLNEDGWEDRLFAALACRTAIRRSVPLPIPPLQHLLADLAASEQPGVCPHGSPLILHLAPAFLDRRFRW